MECKMQKKIYMVVNNDWFFLSHRSIVATRAKNAGYDVTIITRDNGFHDKIKSLGLKVVNLDINPMGMNIYEDLHTLKFLYKIYRSEKPDIVHHVGPKLNLWGSLAARMARVKGVVNAVSGLGVIFKTKGILGKLIPIAFRFTNDIKNLIVIFQNIDDRNIYLKNNIVNNRQCRLIKGSGIDLNEFTYVPEPEDSIINIIFTGRMLKDKGILDILETARIMYPKYKGKIRFLLCGGLVEESRPNYVSAEQLNSLGDENYLSWLGKRDDIKELLEKSHIFIFPSFYGEGLPKSCIEANAIGRPIVTTDSVGCRDTVRDGYNGYIVPIKDPVSLSQKLEILINNKNLRVQMGQNARMFAEENFSIEEVVNKHLEIYDELLK